MVPAGGLAPQNINKKLRQRNQGRLHHPTHCRKTSQLQAWQRGRHEPKPGREEKDRAGGVPRVR